MTREQFESAIENKIPLVLLDNLVLNVGEFMNQHPGGRFLIRHNIGHDISKYFYGGYCLEGNQGSKPAQGHVHSQVAKVIVNDLIVAIYEDDIPTKTLVCKQLKESVKPQNTNTSTIFLQSVDNETHFQSFHSDIRMIGKHFKLRSFANCEVTRHYTICNVMEPELYTHINDALKQNDIGQVQEHLNQRQVQSDTGIFTIKNYQQAKGLSFRFFSDQEHNFEVSGPFGKGLIQKEEGTHIAFAAGTGVLCFVDLVAYLALKNLGSTGKSRTSLQKREKFNLSADYNEFKLILYVSFPNRDSSIALDFFENMQAHCKQFGYTNFELVVRLSQEDSKRRWDIDFIKEIAVGTKGLQKMWVCGPPNLTETFEKAFCQLQEDNVVTRSQVDVL